MYRVTIIEFNAKSTHTHEFEKVIPDFLPASEYDCVEDEVAMTVVYTVLVGVASKLVTIFVGLIVSRVKYYAKFKESGSPFKIPDEIVWLFSIQLQLNFAILYFPTTIILAPLINYLLFWAYRFKLFYFTARPEVNSQDESTAVFVYSIQFLTYIIYLIMLILTTRYVFEPKYWIDDQTKLCGPFP